MFESAEIGHAIDKVTYDHELPALREGLLNAQYDLLHTKKFSVVIVIAGVDGAGKGETVNLLTEWMDPRHIRAHTFGAQTDAEAERPPYWRFWRELPPKGKTAIFLSSWYTDPILSRAYKETRKAELDQALGAARRFEQMLVAEGTLLLKFWFHLSRERQRARLKRLEKNTLTRWRVTDTDWKHHEIYDRFRRVSERTIRETSTGDAPWIVVEGADKRYRSLTVGKVILAALRRRLDEGSDAQAAAPREAPAPRLLPSVDKVDLVGRLDLSQRLEKDVYERELGRYQGKLAAFSRSDAYQKMSIVAVFEGSDAAGKGGAVRRITAALDARHYRVVPIAAPTEEERAQPYLWRFWRHLPPRGVLTIFDRSWYGRVLVERVEGFATEADWMRAYAEINDFEEQLVQSRTVLAKFWLAVSPEEQLRRFKEREATSFKRFKITEEDWRNREKWDAYRQALCDMLDRTSTDHAPWTLVEAEDKYFGRIKVLRTLSDAIDRAMQG